MSRHWRYFVPGFVWVAPLTLVGLVLALVVYRARSWRWNAGLECIGGTFVRDGRTITRIWGRPGAQTLGWLKIYADAGQRSRVDLRIHESAHVVQAFVGAILGQIVCAAIAGGLDFGPMWLVHAGGFLGAVGFAVAYGLCFLVPFAAQGFRDWHRAYRRNPFEIHAYHIDATRRDGFGA